jgi:hypothetical protein
MANANIKTDSLLLIFRYVIEGDIDKSRKCDNIITAYGKRLPLAYKVKSKGGNSDAIG